jgi:hypothetical protein
MTEWVKIDRATGDVLKRRTEDKLERVFNKPVVWIKLEKKDAPDFDANTHKLNATVTQPDLSDLSVAVSPSAKRVEGYEAVALSNKEVIERKDSAYAPPITVTFKLALDQENRIRALESKDALDVAGFQKMLRDNF